MGKGGVDWGLVILLLVSASEVVERVKASHKLEAVCMDQEKVEVEDLPDEGKECIREKAQQRDGRTEVVESGLQKGDGVLWARDGDWTPQDGEDG